MPVTENGHWEIDGVLFGPGTPYGTVSIQGLGVPDSKTLDSDIATEDGGVAGPDYMNPREVIFQWDIDLDPDTPEADDIISAMGSAFRPRNARSDVVVASFRRFGRNRRILGRPRGLVLPWDEDFFMGAGRCSARFYCHDPVVYDDDLSEVTDSGTFDVENAGNYPVWPTIVVTGPGSTVTLTNEETGDDVVLADLSGTATVDFKARSVIVGGTDEYGSVQPSPQWWQLQPGVNSITATGATSVTVQYRSGWTHG